MTLFQFGTPALVMLALSCSLRAQPQPTFRALGFFGPGWAAGRGSVATGVSADGHIVAGHSGPSLTRAFRWTNGGALAGFSIPPNWIWNEATGISANGMVIVGNGGISGMFGTPGGYRYTNGSSAVLSPLLGGMVGSTRAYGTSGDGIVTAGSCVVSNVQRSVRWVWGAPQDLGMLAGGWQTEATGASADGSVMVGYSTSTVGFRAYRWTASSGMVSLGVLPGLNYSHARAVSGDGQTIVGYSRDWSVQNTERAFRWTEAAGMTALPTPPGVQRSDAFGVSGDGSIVVGFASLSGADRAVMWTPQEGMRVLDDVVGSALPAGWSLRVARAVSADGTTIVGEGSSPCGPLEAWVVRLDGQPIPFVCYPNCDGSCSPVLSVADFGCFQTKFVAQDPYADCNADGSLTVADFGCFQTKFVTGCP